MLFKINVYANIVSTLWRNPMHQSNQLPSFSFFQKMFDFIVTDLRASFFKGQIAEDYFLTAMKVVSEIAVKAYNLPSSGAIALRNVEVLMLEESYLAMKIDILSLEPKSEVDELMLQQTVEGFDKSFAVWRQFITVVE